MTYFPGDRPETGIPRVVRLRLVGDIRKNAET